MPHPARSEGLVYVYITIFLQFKKCTLNGSRSKIVVVRSLSSHLSNHSNKKSQTYWALVEK